MMGHLPNALFPQFLRQYNGPEGLFAGLPCAIICGTIDSDLLPLTLIAYDVRFHAPFDHTEEHGLNGAIEFVVLCSRVCGANV